MMKIIVSCCPKKNATHDATETTFPKFKNKLSDYKGYLHGFIWGPWGNIQYNY